MCGAHSLCTDRTARELLTQGRPLLLSVDVNGAAHYWDNCEFTVAVVAADGGAEKVVLAETPFETPSGWCEYTRGSVGGMLGRILVGHWSAISFGVSRHELYCGGTEASAAGREGDS